MAQPREPANGRLGGMPGYWVAGSLDHRHPRPPIFLQHTESGAGAVLAVDYSGDSKTDELIQNFANFRFPPDMDAFLPKTKK